MGGLSEVANQFIDASVGVKIRQSVEQLVITSEALRSTQPVEALIYGLAFCELENYCSGFLQLKVDLVMKDRLKPHIGEQILQEVICL